MAASMPGTMQLLTLASMWSVSASTGVCTHTLYLYLQLQHGPVGDVGHGPLVALGKVDTEHRRRAKEALARLRAETRRVQAHRTHTPVISLIALMPRASPGTAQEPFFYV